MRALCWTGVGDLAVRDVPDPEMLGGDDVVVEVAASSVCGSDLHLLGGDVPAMRKGDVIGHEFVGTVVEAGRQVRSHAVGDRVVVCSVVGCGRCTFCEDGTWSLCDNSNPTPVLEETLYGHAGAGVFGSSHTYGGFPGSHADYVRVPFADHGAFGVPDELSDDQAVFVSDAVPSGWMAAENADIAPGDVVAVWGAGGVGQMAAAAAGLLGAGEVIVIDRYPDRLRAAAEHTGARTVDYSDVDVVDALREMTGGRGPDACVEAVGMEARGSGVASRGDPAKQAARMEPDRGTALLQAIHACRKGGTVSVAGFFAGSVDGFPMGAVMNKSLTLRSGRQHGQRFIPMLLDRVARGELDPSYLATHPLPLEDGPRGYELFAKKADGCLRTVLHPGRG